MLKAACKSPGRDSHSQRESYESDTLQLDHLHLQRHMGVNNLPRVATRQCAGRELNLRPLDHESNALPLHYRATTCFDVFFQAENTTKPFSFAAFNSHQPTGEAYGAPQVPWILLPIPLPIDPFNVLITVPLASPLASYNRPTPCTGLRNTAYAFCKLRY